MFLLNKDHERRVFIIKALLKTLSKYSDISTLISYNKEYIPITEEKIFRPLKEARV